MTRVITKGFDPANYSEAKRLAKHYFNGRAFVACKRKDAELALTLKWKVKWARHKQKTYYFTSMY